MCLVVQFRGQELMLKDKLQGRRSVGSRGHIWLNHLYSESKCAVPIKM